MTDRTIKGKIKAWTKEVREKTGPTGGYFELGFLIDNDWHNLPAEEKATLEKIKVDAPVGSIIELIEWQKEGSTYWNFKPGTFKVLEKGSGFTPKKGSWGYRPNREETLFKEASIQLQGILRTALTATDDLSTEAVKKRADELVKWHNSKIADQFVFLDSLTKNLKAKPSDDKEESVEEEKVEDDGEHLL